MELAGIQEEAVQTVLGTARPCILVRGATLLSHDTLALAGLSGWV